MTGANRYRSLNRVRAEIAEGGAKVWLSGESTPYVQLKKHNTTLGGQPREGGLQELLKVETVGTAYWSLSPDGTKIAVVENLSDVVRIVGPANYRPLYSRIL